MTRRGSRDEPGSLGAGGAGVDELARLERQVTNLFDRLFSPLSPFRSLADAEGAWHPFADVYEGESQYRVRIELAGIDRNSLEVVKEGRCLVVRGVREDPMRGQPMTCHQLEISHGAFERVLCLPTDFRQDAVRAEYGQTSGFLEITIDKE